MSRNTTTDDDFDELRAPDEWRDGDCITVIHAGATANFGEPGSGGITYRRGDIVRVNSGTLTHQQRLLALVEDVDEQIRRWGRQWFARGAIQVERWTEPGDAEWQIARDAERAIANADPDPVQRARKLTELNARFGRVATSQSIDLPRGGLVSRQIAQDEFDRQQRGDRHVVLSRSE
jgi:hypothetical protein